MKKRLNMSAERSRTSNVEKPSDRLTQGQQRSDVDLSVLNDYLKSGHFSSLEELYVTIYNIHGDYIEKGSSDRMEGDKGKKRNWRSMIFKVILAFLASGLLPIFFQCS